MIRRVETERVEFGNLDPVWQIAVQKLSDFGIKGCLFDLDSYLLDTQKIFDWGKGKFIGEVSLATGLSKEYLTVLLNELDWDLKTVYKVNPKRWDYIVAEMGKKLLNDETALMPHIDHLRAIYRTPHEYLPGAAMVLKTLRYDLGNKIAVVTHGNEQYTMDKVRRIGLDDLVDCLIIANEDEDKSIEDWQRGARGLNLHPRQLIGGGDNVLADLVPLSKMGVPLIFGVETELYKGEVPSGVCMMKGIAELPKTIASLPV